MKIEKNRKMKGSVLLTVVSVMALLIIFMTAALALSTSMNNRAHANYSDSQAEYTAKAAIQSFTQAINTNEAVAQTLVSMDIGDVVTPSVIVSNTGMGNVGYYNSDGEFINGAWVKEVVDTTLDQAADRGRKCMLFVCCSALIEMFIYINYMLSQKSTSSSTLRHITSIYVPSTDTSELRKERHFGKIKLISEKKPRAVNATNVQRIYTTLSWQRRSHIRHLASGKIVPVKSAICKRRNAEDASAPQVIYKV